ncbi:MAG: transport between ER and Golgi ATPase protein [Peltula sp. TS41687]|nr:MAG: transport between ER and Golgi ATPase protein [Peltula sp. TS41687]
MSSSEQGKEETANIFVDLSGVSSTGYDNPYDALIEACQGDPAQIQARYEAHRRARNEQQRLKLLDPGFTGVSLDPILQRVHDPSIEPGYVDPRNCLVFWARPPKRIRHLIGDVQQKLLSIAPHLWLMPLDCLHMTTLEVTHSRSAEEIAELVRILRPYASDITDYIYDHRARLIKPILSYDSSAIALSFLPAAGEGHGRSSGEDHYTYHHLRRDMYDLCCKAGVVVDSRYVVPSSHLTIGRFVTSKDMATDGTDKEHSQPDPEKMKKWVEKLEEINHWLRDEYWPEGDDPSSYDTEGEWKVGEEKGLDCRFGTLWYGGGETLRLGKGY